MPAKTPKPKRFRVALSFAGETRDYVAKVAAILAEHFGEEAILYDKYHKVEFAQNRLGIELPALYHNESDLIVVVLCPKYKKKDWTGLEWTAIHALLMKPRKRKQVMLTRFEHATVEGLYANAGFIELDEQSPEQTATDILQRLALNEGKPKDHYTGPPLAAPHTPSAQYDLLKNRYLQRLVEAFSAYEDLETSAISTVDGKERITRIGEIFVAPACAKDRCEADAFDELHEQAKHPDDALLPLLAQEENRRTVLLADPGYGKSTLLQWLIVTLAEHKNPQDAPGLKGCIPLPIIVRDVVRHLPEDIAAWRSWDEVVKAFRKVCPPLAKTHSPLLSDFEGPAHAAEFRTLLDDPHAFFLIDGLDEIGDPEKRRAFRDAVWEGFKTHPKARWLVTSRVIGYDTAGVDQHTIVVPESRGQFTDLDDHTWKYNQPVPEALEAYRRVWGDVPLSPDCTAVAHGGAPAVRCTLAVATRLYLAPFDDSRQRAYALKWFEHRTGTKDDDRALKLIEEAHRHHSVRVISRVPSILCLMAILKRKGLPLPDGRAELYDKITEAYLKTIDEKRHILRPFTDEQAKRWLSIIAIHMQERRAGDRGHEPGSPRSAEEGSGHQGEILATLPDLERWLLPVLTLRCADDAAARAMLQSFLSYVANRSALLQPRGGHLYGFVHLSFLEYFAACYVGPEYKRLQQRLARQRDEEGITEAELDADYPPGPVTYAKEAYPTLAADPSWHEVLVFLVESNAGDKVDLLRWLFPALHTRQPLAPSGKDDAPLLPLPAARLAIKLACDRQLDLGAAKRQDWWRRLWAAHLAWPHEPWDRDESKRWHIAPDLLAPGEHQPEIVRALASQAQEKQVTTLKLSGCTGLSDLTPLQDLGSLRHLFLDGCTGLPAGAAAELQRNLPKCRVVG